MAKVITFSREFPRHHPRRGEKTFFVEKFWESVKPVDSVYLKNSDLSNECHRFLLAQIKKDILPKRHTIRSGKRFKAGDYFSPRVWRGVPYQKCFDRGGNIISSQIILAQDVLITKVYDIEICHSAIIGRTSGVSAIIINGKFFPDWQLLAKNDGLSEFELTAWFNKPMKGQIICWNESVKY